MHVTLNLVSPMDYVKQQCIGNCGTDKLVNTFVRASVVNNEKMYIDKGDQPVIDPPKYIPHGITKDLRKELD